MTLPLTPSPVEGEKTAHTPGPWIWDGDGAICQVGTPPYQYGKSVLRPTYEYDSGVDTEVSEADARLLTAAPDLLDALKDFVYVYALNNAEPEELRSALGNIIGKASLAVCRAEGRAARKDGA